jgi:hypothetical protein
MARYIILIIIIIGNIIFLGRVAAQEDSTKHDTQFFWASGGLGFAAPHRGAAVLSISTQFDDHRISLRAAGVAEFEIFGNYPIEGGMDYGILYGRSFTTNKISCSVNAGVSLVRGIRRGKFLSHDFFSDQYEVIDYTTAGIPVEFDFIGVIAPFFGLGLEAFGNINKEQSFGGILFTIHIGQLK